MGTETATCNNSGLWDPDPALLECKFIYVLSYNACMCAVYDLYIGVVITGAWNVAALSGGFVALVVILVIILVVTITKKRKSR